MLRPADTKSQDCFETVFKLFEENDRSVHPSVITGVLLVSEDDTALPEAKTISRRYFRNVKKENVVQLGGSALPDAVAHPGDATEALSESEQTVVSCSVVVVLVVLTLYHCHTLIGGDSTGSNSSVVEEYIRVKTKRT